MHNVEDELIMFHLARSDEWSEMLRYWESMCWTIRYEGGENHVSQNNVLHRLVSSLDHILNHSHLLRTLGMFSWDSDTSVRNPRIVVSISSWRTRGYAHNKGINSVSIAKMASNGNTVKILCNTRSNNISISHADNDTLTVRIAWSHFPANGRIRWIKNCCIECNGDSSSSILSFLRIRVWISCKSLENKQLDTLRNREKQFSVNYESNNSINSTSESRSNNVVHLVA